MNNSELETLIRNILREQLVPATPRTQRNAIFQTVDEAVCAALLGLFTLSTVPA